MAQYLSAERAVKVKTETPTEIVFVVSDNLHTPIPHGQPSVVYIRPVKGMHVTSRSKSARARERINLEKRN